MSVSKGPLKDNHYFFTRTLTGSFVSLIPVNKNHTEDLDRAGNNA